MGLYDDGTQFIMYFTSGLMLTLICSCRKYYHHLGNCTPNYRKYMYEKFGDEYARDYLLGE